MYPEVNKIKIDINKTMQKRKSFVFVISKLKLHPILKILYENKCSKVYIFFIHTLVRKYNRQNILHPNMTDVLNAMHLYINRYNIDIFLTYPYTLKLIVDLIFLFHNKKKVCYNPQSPICS
jgi:hypothetical protein